MKDQDKKFGHISPDQIEQASQEIDSMVFRTPFKKSIRLSEEFGKEIFLKLENLNYTGSFKVRGASFALQRAMAKQRIHEVVAVSAGNHAQGVAYAARAVNLKSRIFMPEKTPKNKIFKTKHWGAEIELKGKGFDDAYQYAMAYLEKAQDVFFLHPFCNEDVIAGQATVGYEICKQKNDLDSLVVPIGGGGLISGVSQAVKAFSPGTKVYGVQTVAYPGMVEAIHQKRSSLKDKKQDPSSLDLQPNVRATIAEGIAVKKVEPRMVELVDTFVEDVFTVTEDAIALGVVDLMEMENLHVEGCGGVPLACLRQLAQEGTLDRLGNRIGLVVTGGNVDLQLLKRMMDFGLKTSGRLYKFKVELTDTAGSLLAMIQKLAEHEVNILDIKHDRKFATSHLSNAFVEFTIETHSLAHLKRVKENLQIE